LTICNAAAVRAIDKAETSMKLMQTVGNFICMHFAYKIYVNNEEAAWQ